MMSDRAWALIVKHRGRMQGLRFRMTPATLAAIKAERIQRGHPAGSPGFLYSVPVDVDEFMPYGHITLEKP